MSDSKTRTPAVFYLYFFISFMAGSIYTSYTPLYLASIFPGQNDVVGTLLAVAPLFAIAVQPVWGFVGDRAPTKNLLLYVLLAASGLSALLLGASASLLFVALALCLYSIFTSGTAPIVDTLTLEHLQKINRPFGPVRLCGALGYALVAVFTGMVLKDSYNLLFPMLCGVFALSFIISFFLPTVQGHRKRGNKVSAAALFKNKELMLLLGFTFLLQVALGYYYSFHGQYFLEIGGTKQVFGWSVLISCLAEVPFLIFADRIFKKLGAAKMLLIAGLVMGARWILLYMAGTVPVFLVLQTMHGFSYAATTFTMAKYINLNVPPEFKATGQVLLAVIGLGVSRALGSYIGGLLAQSIGMAPTFLVLGIFVLSSVVLFFYVGKRYLKEV